MQKFWLKKNRNTKPGGWVEFQDFDFKYYSVDNSLKEDMPLTKWHNLMIEASIVSRREGCPGPKLKGLIEGAGFVNVTEEVFPFPIGMWPKDKKLVCCLHASVVCALPRFCRIAEDSRDA